MKEPDYETSSDQLIPQPDQQPQTSTRREFLEAMGKLGAGGLALLVGNRLANSFSQRAKSPDTLSTLQYEAYNWIKDHYQSNFSQSNTAFDNLNAHSFGFGTDMASTLGINTRQSFNQDVTNAISLAIRNIGGDIREVYSKFYSMFTYPNLNPVPGGYKLSRLSASGIPHIAVWAFTRNFIPTTQDGFFKVSRYYNITEEGQHILDIVERNFRFAASGQIDLRTGELGQDLFETMFQLYGALGVSRELTDTATYVKLGYLIPQGEDQLLTNRQERFETSTDLAKFILDAYESLPESEQIRIKKEFYSGLISEALNALLLPNGLRGQFLYYTDDIRMLIRGVSNN